MFLTSGVTLNFLTLYPWFCSLTIFRKYLFCTRRQLCHNFGANVILQLEATLGYTAKRSTLRFLGLWKCSLTGSYQSFDGKFPPFHPQPQPKKNYLVSTHKTSVFHNHKDKIMTASPRTSFFLKTKHLVNVLNDTEMFHLMWFMKCNKMNCRHSHIFSSTIVLLIW
jgi:hypothetical protein